jgi:hypothetical protein
MPVPPESVWRTEEQISGLLMERIVSGRIDIDARFAARFAPVARAIAPDASKRGVLATSASQPSPQEKPRRHLDD